MAKRLEDLPLHSKAVEFRRAVSAILEHSQVRRNRRLFEQIDSANDSIEANLAEGFEQPTDAAFAKFVFTAKGSLAEVVVRLRHAAQKGLASGADVSHVEALAEPLGRMMGGFIKYLRSSGFRDRGRHDVSPRKP